MLLFKIDRTLVHINLERYKAMAAFDSWKEKMLLPIVLLFWPAVFWPFTPRNEAFSSFMALSQISESSLKEHYSQPNHTGFLFQHWSKYLICAPRGKQSKHAEIPQMCAGRELQLPFCILGVLQHAAAVSSAAVRNDWNRRRYFQFVKLLMWPWWNYSCTHSAVARHRTHTRTSEKKQDLSKCSYANTRKSPQTKAK